MFCSTCKVIEVTTPGRCSTCNKAYMAAYRKANHEKVKAGQRDHYVRNRAIVKANSREYAKANPEKTKADRAAYYQANKAKVRANMEAWQKANPEKFNAIRRVSCLNRVARKKAAEGKHTIADVQNLYDIQKGKCTACRKSLLDGYHVDHIRPLSKGGTNWPHNLQLLCPTCNLEKHASDWFDFIDKRAR